MKVDFIRTPDGNQRIVDGSLKISSAFALPVFTGAPTIEDNPNEAGYIGMNSSNALVVYNGTTWNVVSLPSGGTSSKYLRGDDTWQTLDTSNVPENTNLYYTQARFDSAFSAKSTSDLSEGSNLYYTASRFNTAFSGKSTTDLSEGTNLYYTNARVEAYAVGIYLKQSAANVSNGYAQLDSSALLPLALFPDSVLGNVKYKGTYNGTVVTSADATLNGNPLPAAASGNQGYYFIVTAIFTLSTVTYQIGDWIISDGSAGYTRVENSDAVTTVFGRNGNIVANASDYAAYYASLTGSYANPNWITSLAQSKITYTGTTSQYIGGDGSLIAFPVNVSSFTNNAGYLTSSSLIGYALVNSQAFTGTPTMPSLGITGTAGLGYISLIAQTVNPITPPTGSQNIYADASGRFTIMGANGFSASFSKSSFTASQIYAFPNASGTIALTATTLAGYGITDAQAPISLTTTGASGAATFISNALNVPNYTLAGLGGVSSSITVAGQALTGNITLANLSATDSTLTFSNTYNASAAQTIGLNLAKANNWTAPINITNTATQLQLNYDGSNNTIFTVSSTGNFTINPSNSTTTISGTLNVTSHLEAGTGTSNFFCPGTTTANVQTVSQYQYNGFSNNYVRTGFYGSTSSTIGTGRTYSAVMVASAPITLGASVNVPFASNFVVKSIGAITLGSGASVTTTASFYIDGASTQGVSNYSLYINSGDFYTAGNIIASAINTYSSGGASTIVRNNTSGRFESIVGSSLYQTNTSGTDAAYTINLTNGDNVILPAITAGRTVTFPTVQDGKVIWIWNLNSSANTWSIASSPAVKSAALATQSTIANQTYTGYMGSSAQSAWIRII